ncbi:MAG TPA: serine/threonine-protein kinase [Gemmataceae bacterium]|nr:serine/threonine-protein kinase [Gemmataceae bacterium]
MSSDVIDSSDPASPPTPAGPSPSQLGEYRLLREIGRGGMGVVYEAVQESLGRHVALKVLPAGLASRGSFLERFHREARVAGRLHHTNIVAVYGVGEQEGSHFYAMQFIRGQGLDAVLQDVRRLRGLDPAAIADPTSFRDGSVGRPRAEAPPAADAAAPPTGGREELVGPTGAVYYRGAARLVRQAAEALAYAHGQGVLHRDVKPSNLLIDWRGAVWITDFGLAKADDAPDLTAPDDPVGTLRYMAPERFQGRCDARSDVYSLGATLYEILTLRPLFDDADRMRLIARIGQETPAPPRKEAPDLPHDLETIVLKATARDPADRYGAAAELADDLRRFLEDRPIAARRASVLERLRRWRRRNPATAGLAFSVAGLLLLLAVGSTAAAAWLAWQRGEVGRANAALEDVNAQLGATNDQLTAANGKLMQDKIDLATADQKREAEQTQRLWTSLYEQARAGRFGPRPGRRIDGLAALAEARKIRLDDRLRTEAIACLTLTDLKPGPDCGGWPDGAFDVDFDDQLERYAVADRRGVVSVRRTDDDAEVAHITTAFNGPASVELSRDGRFIGVRADGGSGRLQVWQVGEAAPRIDEPAGVVATAFSADGRRLAVVRADGDTDIDDLSNGQNLLKLQAGLHCRAAAFRPDGGVLAVAGETAVTFCDPQTGKKVGEWATRFSRGEVASPLPAMETLAWRPDGGLLAAVGRDGRIGFWDPATATLRAKTSDPLTANVRIAFDHAGDLLASRDASEVLRLWDPRTGRQVFAVPSDTRALRFRSDDRRLAAEIDGRELRMWEVAVGREYRTLTAEPVGAAAPEFSGGAAIRRDGRLLAAAMSDGVRLWDLATGEQCAWLRDKDGTAAVAFAGDKALLTHGVGMEAPVVRWPIQADGAGALRIGPPEVLPLRGSGGGLACSADGRVIAVATLRGVQVLGVDHGAKPIDLQLREDSGDDERDTAVSPDGRWVAACSHGTKGVRVWDVEKGAVALEIPVEGPAAAVFSPDGQWLAAGGKDDCHVWTVGAWQKGPQIEGAASAFAPDGALLAVETGRGIVRLVDPQTGKCAAQLEDPNQDRSDVYFTPDGAVMAAVSLEGRCIHVWDLRRIRQGLAEISLDWERPAYPAAAPAPSLRVKVVGAP